MHLAGKLTVRDVQPHVAALIVHDGLPSPMGYEWPIIASLTVANLNQSIPRAGATYPAEDCLAVVFPAGRTM